MSQSDERLERLISRKLDGEISDEESLELDKWLIRDVQARCAFEELSRIDSLASEVLSHAWAQCGETAAAVEQLNQRRRLSAWWGLGLAAAAACLAFVLIRPSPVPRDVATGFPNADPGVFGPAHNRARLDLNQAPSFELASYSAEPVRQTGTTVDYYGMFDEGQEKLYLLEVKQTTIRQRNDKLKVPTTQGKVILTSGEM